MNRGPSFYSGSPEVVPITSPDIALATGAQVYSFAHCLPFIPKNWRAVIVCLVADGAYSQGDEVNATSWVQQGSATVCAGLVADITNLTVVQRATVGIFDKDGGASFAIAVAKWRLRFYILP